MVLLFLSCHINYLATFQAMATSAHTVRLTRQEKQTEESVETNLDAVWTLTVTAAQTSRDHWGELSKWQKVRQMNLTEAQAHLKYSTLGKIVSSCATGL